MIGPALLLTFCMAIAHALDPLICSTHAPPVVYRIPSVNPCETGPLNLTRLVVSYNRPVHTRISGWRLRIMDVTCVTHFFFWGSYTSTLRYERSSDAEFPTMEMGLTCPGGTIRYTTDKGLEDSICSYSWPSSAEKTRRVCYIERAELLSFEGIVTIDGHPATSCKGSVCLISPSEMFYHATGIEPHRTELKTHYSGPGACNDALCVIPSLREAYPVINIIQAASQNNSMQYESISGSRVWVSPPSTRHEPVEGDLPIADAAVLAKMESLGEEISTMASEVSHICKSIKTLYSSILSLTRTAPSVAASMYLNRTDVHAQYLSGHLMVWPCVVVDKWTYRNITGCTAYIPITYSTAGGAKQGFLDSQNNRVYTSSPAGICGIHYFIYGQELIGLHQRSGNESYITRQPTTSRETGPLFEKVELKASSWASSSSSLHETQPREFSYADITHPINEDGKTWLEDEIDKTYPFMSYIIHLKVATVCGVACLAIALGLLGKHIFILHMKVRRIEMSLVEGMALQNLYKA